MFPFLHLKYSEITSNSNSSGIFLCSKAIRDEGTSYHYEKASKFAYPNLRLTKKIGKIMDEMGVIYEKGTNWTTDAPYRECLEEIRGFRKLNVVSVDMEASALFTVAKKDTST